MATSCSCTKCLKSICKIVFYCTCWLKFSSFRGVLENLFQKISQDFQVNARSSHLEVFCEKVFLKFSQISLENICIGDEYSETVAFPQNLQNFEEHLRTNIFLTLPKQRLQHSCFLVNFVNYSTTPILQSITNSWF